ncbi:uncharacterized protein [Sinocyclocheilus grahami]|uniref:uncharacterized protein n=1 Tax=Sinocyclocheilus grahami TaxID=75366 RepID=UPI0007ACDC92|nr:PREDICTED: uncharacterized protein LOC107565498 [Sinocyclocheilus grahami]
MQLKTFFKAAIKLISKKNAITSVPLSFMLLGLQALLDVQFSCPCKVKWNALISGFLFIVPSLFAFVIMFMLLRPCKYKCSHSQRKNSGGRTQGQDNNEASQEEDKSGQSQEQNKSAIYQSEETRQSFETVLMACLIPPIVWICIFLIDGDYVACGFTDWNGRYACDKDLHPICLNWCKPTELNQGGNETELYEQTRELIDQSKCIGYSLAFVFCIIAIIIVTANDCNKGRNSACCRSADPENKVEERTDLLADLCKKQSVQHEMGKLQDDASRHRHPSQVLEIEEKV